MGEAEVLDKVWLVGRGGGRASMDTGTTANHTTYRPTGMVMMPP